jgi:hypothetical protein
MHAKSSGVGILVCAASVDQVLCQDIRISSQGSDSLLCMCIYVRISCELMCVCNMYCVMDMCVHLYEFVPVCTNTYFFPYTYKKILGVCKQIVGKFSASARFCRKSAWFLDAYVRAQHSLLLVSSVCWALISSISSVFNIGTIKKVRSKVYTYACMYGCACAYACV